MPATPIVKSTRYFRPGITKVLWVESITNPQAPTRAELDAGTDLSGEVAELEGWQVTSESVEAPDLGSRFLARVPGRVSVEDSSITLYADAESQDVRSVLARDDAGYVVIMDEGDVAGRLMDVFPVQVASVGKDRSLDDPARIVVQFTITSEPAENVTVPS